MIEFFLGFILMLFFFMISKFNTFLHGPNSNDYKKKLYYDSINKKYYRFETKITICPSKNRILFKI